MAEPFDNIPKTTFTHHRLEGLPEQPNVEALLPRLGEVLVDQMLLGVSEDEDDQGELWTHLVFENGYTLLIQGPWVLLHPRQQ